MTSIVALARPAVRPAVHAGRRLLRTLLRPMAWFWALLVAAVVLITVILALTGVTHVSVVAFGRQAGIWFPFSMCVFIASAYVRVHIATGMTRRTFVRAALAVALLVAVGNALLMSTLLFVERLVHGWLGWGWVLQDGSLDPTGGSWPTMLLDYGLTFVVANLCGLLVGIVFYALGAAKGSMAGVWWATALLPVMVAPVFVLLGLIAGVQGPWPDRLTAYLLPPVGSVAALGLAMAVVVALVFVLVARRTAVARPAR
jgi:hypothetical protein